MFLMLSINCGIQFSKVGAIIVKQIQFKFVIVMVKPSIYSISSSCDASRHSGCIKILSFTTWAAELYGRNEGGVFIRITHRTGCCNR